MLVWALQLAFAFARWFEAVELLFSVSSQYGGGVFAQFFLVMRAAAALVLFLAIWPVVAHVVCATSTPSPAFWPLKQRLQL